MKGNVPLGWKIVRPEARSTLDFASLAAMVPNIRSMEAVREVKMWFM